MTARSCSATECFSDKEVHDVVTHLRTLQARLGGKPLAARELLHELDFLLNRKTFRFEALRRCTEQRWADRLWTRWRVLRIGGSSCLTRQKWDIDLFRGAEVVPANLAL